MKKFGAYTKYITLFILGAALIAVYKTFDNFQNLWLGISAFFKALTPFTIGFVIAYLLNIPCKRLSGKLEHAKKPYFKKHAKGLSIFTVYFAALTLFFLGMRMLVPKIYANVLDLYNNLIPFTQNALQKIDELQKSHGISILEINENTAKLALQQALSGIDVTQFGKYAEGAINLTSGVLNAFIGLIVSVYMLLEKEAILAACGRLTRAFFSEKKTILLRDYVLKINQVFSRYIYSRVLDALIIAVLGTIVLLILNLKYALVFGLFLGLCNLIPYFGSIIGTVVIALFAVFSGGWTSGVWTALSLLVLEQIDGNLIGPKIMSEQLDASPLWIIFAVSAGGKLFGVLGMLLSVPVLVVVKLILSDLLHAREAKRKAADE